MDQSPIFEADGEKGWLIFEIFDRFEMIRIDQSLCRTVDKVCTAVVCVDRSPEKSVQTVSYFHKT